MKKRVWIIILTGILGAAASCGTIHSVFVGDGDKNSIQPPIRDPFGYSASLAGQSAGTQPTILRSKKGDRSIELELPPGPNDNTDLVVPLSSAFKGDMGRGLASDSNTNPSGVDETYLERHPTMADREITSSFPQTTFDDRGRRADVEQGLGVIPAEDSTPARDASYLAGIDRIKQLYRLGRFEAALIETDGMIRDYQTDAHLYEMRGTLLDRIGKRELAIKSWNQALRFDPANAKLKRFVERKRRIATEAESADNAAAQPPSREPASADKKPGDDAAPAQKSTPEGAEQ